MTGIDGTDFAGQITNRVAFAFTAPATLVTANDDFRTDASINSASADGTGGVGIATTTFFVSAADMIGVVAGVSSASLTTILVLHLLKHQLLLQVLLPLQLVVLQD